MKDSWWRGGVIYQVYPRSFQDSNGDGCGDLNGIASRLDYIAELGVDAIWISPFLKSPMKDFGYDVMDYRDVDGIFGTLDDFDKLIAQAHERGIKVMMDLVVSHTSDRHPWFIESRQGSDNPKSDWYVWADAAPDGTPPNNWLSVFGGPAWQWDTTRRRYYLHNFLASQPDLNFHNPEVRGEILSIAEFWMKRGVDGFRLDTINFYFHDHLLRNNPVLPPEQRNSNIAPAVNPYNYQDHVYDRNRPENLKFLEALRSVMDQYEDRAAVGEVGDAVHGLDLIAEYTQGNNRMHMCYAFDLLGPKKLNPARVRQIISDFYGIAPDSWPCWALSNHDVMRHATRLTGDDATADSEARMLAGLLLSLDGSICLYQGEELGFEEADLPFEALQDPYGIAFWPEFKGRDGCRTPMVWNDAAPHGGFSEAPQTWLPVCGEHLSKAASLQTGRSDSMLTHYRELLAMRKSHPALRSGRIEFLDTTEDGLLVFLRKSGSQTILCLFNMGEKQARFNLPADKKWCPIKAGHFTADWQDAYVELCGFNAAWAVQESS